jgi:hypothetical protein
MVFRQMMNSIVKLIKLPFLLALVVILLPYLLYKILSASSRMESDKRSGEGASDLDIAVYEIKKKLEEYDRELASKIDVVDIRVVHTILSSKLSYFATQRGEVLKPGIKACIVRDVLIAEYLDS